MQRQILDALVTEPVSAKIAALYAQLGTKPGWKARTELCFRLADANGKTIVANSMFNPHVTGHIDPVTGTGKLTNGSWTSSFSRAVRILEKRGLIERGGYGKQQFLRLAERIKKSNRPR